MGYFDGIVDASFKKDAQGQDLFYPWGILGSGYILGSDEKRNQIRTFLKRTYMAAFPATLVIYLAAGIVPASILMVAFYVWFLPKIFKITKGLPRSTEKLKASEAYRNSARSHNMITLILLTAVSVFATLMGLLIVVAKPSVFVGYAITLMFGACTLAIGYMLKSKINSRKAT